MYFMHFCSLLLLITMKWFTSEFCAEILAEIGYELMNFTQGVITQ